MDRRAFLAALAGAGAARFLCPKGICAPVPPALVIAPNEVATAVARAGTKDKLNAEWIVQESLRLLSRNLQDLRMDRYAADCDYRNGYRVGDTVHLRDPREPRFVPFYTPLLGISPRVPVNLTKQTGADLIIPIQDFCLPPAVFSTRYLKPVMKAMANHVYSVTHRSRHGKGVLVSARLDLPQGMNMAASGSAAGLNLRFLRAYDCTSDRFVTRFDMLHGVVEL